jgi:hypothetical protein
MLGGGKRIEGVIGRPAWSCEVTRFLARRDKKELDQKKNQLENVKLKHLQIELVFLS